MRKVKIASMAASAVLLGSGLTAAVAGPSAASDSPVSPARACTENAPRFTSYPGTGANDPAYWPARGTYATTTTRCKDINVKLSSAARDVRTCFKKGSGWECNSWRRIGGSWKLAAEDVLDGTKFFLQFKGTSRATGSFDY
ncbi:MULTISPECIES: hypothetical protein [unclassified Streptomyces]|uniref:hypothetical protein n=1 Tax=unclassified Streptomyces TaxID=2593676 RepID=UPI001CBE3876|nr:MULTISPECIES: hypothetical protein [unclassified Streptomyces]WPO73727.1 hypothetical protein R9806_25415 [Streptomyces sp. KN37]